MTDQLDRPVVCSVPVGRTAALDSLHQLIEQGCVVEHTPTSA
jgi:hypothetical protein